MVKDWLQKSSVMTRAANNNYQKALNADALKYQDKVITKKDLIKGQTPSRNNKGPLNTLSKAKKKLKEGSKDTKTQPKKQDAFDKQISLRLPRVDSRNPSSNTRQLSQRSPMTKNLTLQVHNL